MTDSDNPRFVQFGAITTIPGPYLCESAELYGFFFRADHDRLLELCTKVFREPTGGEVDYRPLGGHVLVTFGRIKRITPQTPPFNQWGNLAEDQVAVWVPVVAVHDTGAVLDARRFAMFVPYIWLDDPLSMATGREAGGWPKSWGWPVFSATSRPLDLKLDVYGWNFGPDHHPRRRRLLRITEGAGPDGRKPRSFKSLGELLGEFWASVWDDDGLLVPDPGLGLDLLKDAFREELPQVFLKQIRSADDPATAALQQVVTSIAKVRRLSGPLLLGQHHLKVWPLDSSPVLQELGLVDQTARMAFKVDMEFVQEPGRVLWDAALAAPRVVDVTERAPDVVPT